LSRLGYEVTTKGTQNLLVPEKPHHKKFHASPEEHLIEEKAAQALRAEGIDFDTVRTAETTHGKFIGGKFIELGFCTDEEVGKMAALAEDKPSGFHGRKIGKHGLGMVGNAEGFGGPNTMMLTIDYVWPGTPEEGFYLGYISDTGEKHGCKNCGSNVTVYKKDDTAISHTVAQRDDLTADIQITLGKTDKFFRTDVRLKNIGSKTMSNARYMRALNPDNDMDQAGSLTTHTIRGETCDTCADAKTVVAKSSSVNPYAETASGKTAKLIFWTKDPNGVTSYGHDKVVPESTFDEDVWDHPPSEGVAVIEDTFVSVTFAFSTLAPNQTVDMTYYTAMDWDDTPEILGKLATADVEARGFCSAFTCPDNLVEKHVMPVSCSGATCNEGECCVPRGKCSSMNCAHYGDWQVTTGADTIECLKQHCGAPDLETCCDKNCDTFDEDAGDRGNESYATRLVAS
jgi:hypothetical protein